MTREEKILMLEKMLFLDEYSVENLNVGDVFIYLVPGTSKIAQISIIIGIEHPFDELFELSWVKLEAGSGNSIKFRTLCDAGNCPVLDLKAWILLKGKQ